MQRTHKSARHVAAANARWRADKAQAERDAGIPDLPMPEDFRRVFTMPLKLAGWRNVRFEPRAGYVSWRLLDDDTDELLHCAAMKELLRWVARRMPRMLAARNFH